MPNVKKKGNVVSYKLKKPLFSKEVGDVVQMDEDDAVSLGEFLEPASVEDCNKDEDSDGVVTEDEDADDVSTLGKSLEHRIAAAVAKGVKALDTSKKKLIPVGSVPAEPKGDGKIFRSGTELIRTMYKAQAYGDVQSRNKVAAHKLRYKAAISPAQAETSNTLGAATIIPDYLDEIWQKTPYYPNLLELTRQEKLSGYELIVPYLNENSRVDGSRWGGIQSYYVSENNTGTFSTMNTQQQTYSLATLMVLNGISVQCLEDNSYDLDRYIADVVGLEFKFKFNDGIINGPGTGNQCLGILSQPSLITVTTASAARTIAYADLVNMWVRLYYPSQTNSVWLMNQNVYSQLLTMVFNSTSGFPAFGALAFSAHDEFPLTIFGRPCIVTEQNATLGLTGDIILCDLSQLITGRKELEMAMSTEFAFSSYQTAFRWVCRWTGNSPWQAALTPYEGSVTTSPYVVLATRGS